MHLKINHFYGLIPTIPQLRLAKSELYSVMSLLKMEEVSIFDIGLKMRNVVSDAVLDDKKKKKR